MRATIGQEVTRQDGRRFRLVGIQGANWVAEDLDGAFGAPVTLTPAELASGFDVDDVSFPETETQIVRRRDVEALESAKGYYASNDPRPRKQSPLPPAGSPERTFIENGARAIFNDPDQLAQYEIGQLEVGPAAAYLLDGWIAARNREADKPKPKRGRR